MQSHIVPHRLQIKDLRKLHSPVLSRHGKHQPGRFFLFLLPKQIQDRKKSLLCHRLHQIPDGIYLIPLKHILPKIGKKDDGDVLIHPSDSFCQLHAVHSPDGGLFLLPHINIQNQQIVGKGAVLSGQTMLKQKFLRAPEAGKRAADTALFPIRLQHRFQIPGLLLFIFQTGDPQFRLFHIPSPSDYFSFSMISYSGISFTRKSSQPFSAGRS